MHLERSLRTFYESAPYAPPGISRVRSSGDPLRRALECSYPFSSLYTVACSNVSPGYNLRVLERARTRQDENNFRFRRGRYAGCLSRRGLDLFMQNMKNAKIILSGFPDGAKVIGTSVRWGKCSRVAVYNEYKLTHGEYKTRMIHHRCPRSRDEQHNGLILPACATCSTRHRYDILRLRKRKKNVPRANKVFRKGPPCIPRNDAT